MLLIHTSEQKQQKSRTIINLIINFQMSKIIFPKKKDKNIKGKMIREKSSNHLNQFRQMAKRLDSKEQNTIHEFFPSILFSLLNPENRAFFFCFISNQFSFLMILFFNK